MVHCVHRGRSGDTRNTGIRKSTAVLKVTVL